MDFCSINGPSVPAHLAALVLPQLAQVKRVYMKANLVVHPDKVKQKGGTLEQVRTCLASKGEGW